MLCGDWLAFRVPPGWFGRRANPWTLTTLPSVQLCVCKASGWVPDSPSPVVLYSPGLLASLLGFTSLPQGTHSHLRSHFTPRTSTKFHAYARVSHHISRPLCNVNLLNLPDEIIEIIIQFTADVLALLLDRLVSRYGQTRIELGSPYI